LEEVKQKKEKEKEGAVGGEARRRRVKTPRRTTSFVTEHDPASTRHPLSSLRKGTIISEVIGRRGSVRRRNEDGKDGKGER